jgi:tripartite-type tricarboxylate transporter receptor subunit TctC
LLLGFVRDFASWVVEQQEEENMRLITLSFFSAALVLAVPPTAWSQSWPVKPIRVVVNSAAGSGIDIVTRALATPLSEALAQNVVVDNRAGAGGNIGLEIVAKAAPDGYTLLSSPGGGIVMAPHLYRLGVDVDRDLVPVAPTASLTIFLVVRPDLPVRSVAELIAYAKNNPGKLNFGSSGTGGSLHIAGEMLLRAANIQAVHVPFKGGAPAVVALLGNQIDFLFDPGPSVVHVKAGRLRLLAVARSTRSALFPDAPTMAEAGADVDVELVQGVYAPTGTPREIVTRLNREILRIMQTPEVAGAIARIGGEVVSATPEEFAARQRSERERYGRFIRQANIRVE